MEQLDTAGGKCEETENSFGLKTDDRLFLGVEGPLEATEIEVDSHETSLPKASEQENVSAYSRGPLLHDS